MINVVVAAHGDLADALVATAKLVVNSHGPVVAVGFREHDDTSSYQRRLAEAVFGIDDESAVLVLTDMFGGTPCNVAMTMHQVDRVEVLTGANLAMVIKALQLSTKKIPLAAAASRVKEYGGQAIAIASEVLGARGSKTRGEGSA